MFGYFLRGGAFSDERGERMNSAYPPLVMGIVMLLVLEFCLEVQRSSLFSPEMLEGILLGDGVVEPSSSILVLDFVYISAKQIHGTEMTNKTQQI
jgi:hypothetical protein